MYITGIYGEKATMRLSVLPTLILVIALIGFAEPSGAASFQELDARVAASGLVLKNALDMPDRGIPRDLLRRCRGLAIFPNVFKVGIILGASYGNGIIFRRDEKNGEWSKPAFFRLQIGSLGLQLGAQYTDLVLLIMSESAMQRLLEDKFVLGADISVAAGPVGRTASAETNTSLESGILSYSRSSGLFAGLAFNGGSLIPDKAANEVFHGKNISVQDIFYEGSGEISDNSRILLKTLDNAVEVAVK